MVVFDKASLTYHQIELY
ncbi:hypothetical protein D049_1030A, partial [Vibrio parahaemolyticus VPTS-2010]